MKFPQLSAPRSASASIDTRCHPTATFSTCGPVATSSSSAAPARRRAGIATSTATPIAATAQAGVAPRAFYNHFDGNNGLLESIWTDGFEQLRECVILRRAGPLDDLREVGLAYRRFALARRAHYTVMFMHRFVGSEPSLGASHAAARAFEALVNQVERAGVRPLHRAPRR
ncbi:MAG: TetR/AcrR family transcriptional regulator [Acidimicrobiales bacterium]